MLAQTVLREVFGKHLALPVDTKNRNGPRDIIDDYGVRIQIPSEGDACVMTHAQDTKWHVGVVGVVNHRIWVLHSMVTTGVVFTRARDLSKMNLRIEGYYQWR
jgi:hypothetical protein